MSTKALGRARQLEVHKEGKRITFYVLESKDAGGRRINTHRTREPDLARMMSGLRSKYKIPADNVSYFGFPPSDLIRNLGGTIVDDQAHLDGDALDDGHGADADAVLEVPEEGAEAPEPKGDEDAPD
jgi:hypothetical protein